MIGDWVLGRYSLALIALFTLQTNSQTAAEEPPTHPLVAKTTSNSGENLQSTQKKLDAARSKTKALHRKAKKLDQNIQHLRKSLVATARIIRVHEQKISVLGARLIVLNSRQKILKKQFKANRHELGTILAALQRMARNPPEALIAQPIPPADMVRSAILLRAVLPQLKGKAQAFGKNLAKLASAREEARNKRSELNNEHSELEEQRLVLKRMLGRKSRLRRRTVQQTKAAERQANALARRAANLQELMTSLERVRTKQPPHNHRSQKPITLAAPRAITTVPKKRPMVASFKSGRGHMPFPVIGRIIARFGQPISSGRIHRGLTIETTASAQIIAPHEGKVAFAGPFRSYGQLLIIKHPGGYHSLLAGMVRIDATIGQWLLTGEPTGIMGQTKKISINGRRHVQKPALYIEFRHKGEPMDPLAWLATTKDKVSG